MTAVVEPPVAAPAPAGDEVVTTPAAIDAVPAPPLAPRPAPVAPPGVARARAVARRVLTRRNLGVAALAVVVLVVFDRGVAPAMARYRQDHLESDFVNRRPSITTGDALAVLQIQSIGVNVIVAEGDSRTVLRGGPGHVASTPAPGEPGNVIVVGRSTRYGADFADLGSVQKGAPIVVQVRGGAAPVRYVVEQVVRQGAGAPLPTSAVAESLTLITARGGTLSSDRVVVVAGRDGAAAAAATPSSYPAPAPTSGEAVGLAVWVSVAAALGATWWRARRRVRSWSPALVVPLVAIGGAVLLQLLLAADAVLPALH